MSSYVMADFLFQVNTSNFTSLNPPTVKLWPNKILIIVYLIIFIVGLFGNVIVIYFVLYYKRMQSMTNKFITNLALADLLVIFICIPDEVTRLLETQWKYEKFFCMITNFSQGISLCVSVMTLTAISIDRYYIIYKPVKARSIYTHKRVRIIVILIWIVSVIIMSPILFITKYQHLPFLEGVLANGKFSGITMCVENWPHMELKLIYGIFLSCILFLFPISFMSYAYYSISKTLWFTNENKSESLLKSALVETVQIVSLTNKQGDFDLKNKLNAQNLIIKNKTNSQSEKLANSIQSEKFVNVNSEHSKNCFMEIEKVSSKTDNDTYPYKFSLNKEELEHKPGRFRFCNSPKHAKSSEMVLKKKSAKKTAKTLVHQLTFENMDVRLHRRMNPILGSVLNKNELAINKLISSRQRVVKLLIILLLLFAISWLPYHINGVLIDLAAIWEVLSDKKKVLSHNKKEKAFQYTQTLIEQLFPISLCLALANSATNPVCFIALSQSFREKFKASCCNCFKSNFTKFKKVNM